MLVVVEVQIIMMPVLPRLVELVAVVPVVLDSLMLLQHKQVTVPPDLVAVEAVIMDTMLITLMAVLVVVEL
tara:strand:+ start:297 stop:509 length:213 start_codon:yes stop_codon:yes gene_type:complete